MPSNVAFLLAALVIVASVQISLTEVRMWRTRGRPGSCEMRRQTKIVGGDLHSSVPPYGKLQFVVHQEIECIIVCLAYRSCHAYSYDQTAEVVRRYGGCQCQLKGEHGWRFVPSHGYGETSGKCTRG